MRKNRKDEYSSSNSYHPNYVNVPDNESPSVVDPKEMITVQGEFKDNVLILRSLSLKT